MSICLQIRLPANKQVFISAILGLTSAQYWQHSVQDTPEVAAAKAAHFAAVEKAKLSTASNHLNGLYKSSFKKPIWPNNRYGPSTKYSGPIALPPGYHKNGAPLPVLDTPEVAAEKAKHFALVARSAPAYNHDSTVNQYYLGQHVSIPYKVHHHVDYNNDHLGLYRSKRAADFGFNHGFAAFNHFQQPAIFAAHDSVNKYHGPIALPPGYDKHGAPLPVLDTPEVAAEKAKHLAIVAKERAWYDDHASSLGDDHLGGSDEFGDGNHGVISSLHEGGVSGGVAGLHNVWTPTTGPFGSDFKYQGPIALPPGYDKHGAPLPVLDTPEVSAGKAHHFAAYAKIAADHQLAKGAHPFYNHF